MFPLPHALSHGFSKSRSRAITSWAFGDDSAVNPRCSHRITAYLYEHSLSYFLFGESMERR
jgi:hypothetical protein